jgi:hypothetical protein
MNKSIFSWVLGGASLLSSFACADNLFFSPQAIESHMKGYSDEEKVAIEKDLDVVRSVCSSGLSEPEQKPLYVATAGGPGARKTTILERFLQDSSLQSNVTYLDPDQRALKFMAHTYYSQTLSVLETNGYENYSMAVKKAYEKWRGASNYITLTLLEEAFSHKKSIAHGTTSTGEHIPSFLAKVKEAGYDITLLLCSCEDAFRKAAIQYRNDEQKFYQSSPEDALSKGKLFPQRMSAYFTYADTLYLYWSDDLATPERLAAVLKDGQFEVVDQAALDRFVQKFENDRSELSSTTEIPSWDEVVSLYTERFTQ